MISHQNIEKFPKYPDIYFERENLLVGMQIFDRYLKWNNQEVKSELCGKLKLLKTLKLKLNSS